MYVSAPSWRGTSPVYRLRTARQVRSSSPVPLGGRYLGRGLGDAPLPPCSSITTPPGFVGPVQCDPTLGPPSYSPSASQFADLSNQVQDLASTLVAYPPAGGTFTDFLNQHSTGIVIAGASLLGILVLAKALGPNR